ncbi:MAG: hypothetical protein GX783_06120 [Clostridiales bacterium]|nr:hypothetical protein [Clostridiales bacterium]
MSKKVIPIIGNITFALTIILGAYILISTYLVRSSLPAGVCPIDNNRMLIYITIGLGIITFVLSFFDKKEAETMEK